MDTVKSLHLCDEVMQINHKRVQRIMREEGLQCRFKVKKRKRIGQPIQVADHLLKQDFQANHPLQKLVTDITYLPYDGKMHLSSIWTYTMARSSPTILETSKILPSLRYFK
ncbi:IS3 family transposase [Brevibacillus laterosporus]|uniref:IS3 family transposase n=1 Tax=Brevibacillus laterosporus TaxID=1465 RepID=UPI003AF09913